MHPVLFSVGAHELRSYAVFVGLGITLGFLVRRVEVRRLGHGVMPGYAWVPAGAMLGAVLGSKLGMLLFEPWSGMRQLWEMALQWDFSGKTVVGGIAGGYVGVEIAKKLVGITRSTGDAFAVALPLAQGIGRIGCFLEGCCYGAPTDLPWAVPMAGTGRHPAQLYEAVLDLGLAAWLWTVRERPRPNGHLFRRTLVGYALIRFGLEFLRGDNGPSWGSLTRVQWVCLAAAVGFGALIVRGERRS